MAVDSRLTFYLERDPAPLLSRHLERLERCRRRLVSRLSDAPSGAALGQYLERGKMLRAALVFLASGAAGGDPDDAMPAAEAIELLHGAALFHDDLIDAAGERRGLPALHRRVGQNAALVLGDYLLVRAFDALEEARAIHPADRVLDAVKTLSRLAQECCTGQIAELEVSDQPVSEEDYLSIIRGKTSAPFMAAAVLGGLLGGGTSAAIEQLRRYGLSLGIAFQIYDDLLDVAGVESSLGKPVGNSVANGRPMLPLIYLREHGVPVEALRPGLEDLRVLLETHGIFDRIRAIQQKFIDGALAAVAGLAPSVDVEILRTLPGHATAWWAPPEERIPSLQRPSRAASEKAEWMIGLAPGVSIRTHGSDAFVERAGGEPLVLPGEAVRLRRLTEMLATPRPEAVLEEAAGTEPGAPPPLSFLRLLREHEVLVPQPLAPNLIELHGRTLPPQNWPFLDPGYDLQRFLRDQAGDVALTLPPPRAEDVSLTTALHARRSVRRFTGRALTAGELGTLLGLGAGIKDDPLPVVPMGPPGRRTYPSGGGLYPIELMVQATRVEGLAPAGYLYQVLGHRLVRFAALDEEDPSVERMLRANRIEGASLLLYLFMDFARSCLGKYGEKAYRLALLEAGHLAQNLLLVAAALKLSGVPLCGFDDEQLSLSAGLSFPQEAIVYAIAIGEEHGLH